MIYAVNIFTNDGAASSYLAHVQNGNAVTNLTRFAFGLKSDVKDNICFQDDYITVYPAGDNIIIYDINRKTQKFINGASVGVGVETIGKLIIYCNLVR